VTPADTLATLGAIEQGLTQVGHQFELGQGLAAAQAALAQ
jgi:aspartate aminotransferase-like enzyme